MPSGVPARTGWADLHPGLLSRIVVKVAFSSNFTCQSVCSAWCRAMAVQPAPRVWGDQLTFLQQSDKVQLAVGAQESVIVMSNSTKLVSLLQWVLNRRTSWRCFSLGTPNMSLSESAGLHQLAVLLNILDGEEPALDAGVHLRGNAWLVRTWHVGCWALAIAGTCCCRP